MELSPLSTNSFKLYGIGEWFAYRRKNGLSVKFKKYWRKYLALATYATKVGLQIPVTSVACAEIWPYINEALIQMGIYDLLSGGAYEPEEFDVNKFNPMHSIRPHLGADGETITKWVDYFVENYDSFAVTLQYA